MRLAALSAIALLAVAACERAEAPPEPQPALRVEVPVSDELPGLAAAATGLAFWEHPALPFNSVMIVAGSEGATAYNIEDGVEVARIDGVAADGAAVSYAGFGPSAAGVLALFDGAENAFQFYGVDNVSRAFSLLEGGPSIDGAVQGFCFGRAQETSAPSLFVLQDAQIRIFNFEAVDGDLVSQGDGALDAPAGLVSCAVDVDGVLLAASSGGDIYRLDGPDSFSAPFASADVANAGSLSIAPAVMEDAEGGEEISGQIVLLDKADGAAHVFDRASGASIGAVAVSGTEQMPGVAAARTMALTAANFGALYRNGVVAYAVVADEAADGSAAVRLIPYNAVLNALSLSEGTPLSLRGKATATPQGADLIIDAPFNPAPGQ